MSADTYRCYLLPRTSVMDCGAGLMVAWRGENYERDWEIKR